MFCRTHVYTRAAAGGIIALLLLLLLLRYRSDQYRRFEDKMDNENDSLCTYTHDLRGRKIIIAKEHITHCSAAGGAKCLTRARMQITRTTRRGRKCSVYIRKGSTFLFFFLFHVYIKNKTEHLYCVCLRIQSDTLTRGYRISYYSQGLYVCTC